MGQARLQEAGAGRLRIEGELDFQSVPPLWQALAPRIAEAPRLVLSLDGVARANSAGLALLLAALERAAACAHELRLEAVPGNLLELAELSNARGLLGLD